MVTVLGSVIPSLFIDFYDIIITVVIIIGGLTMTRELTALKVRGSLGEILEKVYYKGEEYVIKRGKKPMAVLIPLDEFESYKKQREADMKIFDKIRAKAKAYSTKEIEADVEEAIKAVRKGA